MKKVVIGCLGVLFLLAAAGVVLGYYFVYRPVTAFVSEMQAVAQEFEEAVSLDENVRNTDPFAAPETGELDAEQVERFVAVQRTIHASSAAEGNALEARAEAFRAEFETEAETPREALARLRAVPEMLHQLGNAYLAIKRAQVDALNAQGFSLDEYAWVKKRFFEALGFDIAAVDLRELREQLEQLEQVDGMKPVGVDWELPGDPGEAKPTTVEVPQVNQDLVAPYAAEAEGWFTLAGLGL